MSRRLTSILATGTDRFRVPLIDVVDESAEGRGGRASFVCPRCGRKITIRSGKWTPVAESIGTNYNYKSCVGCKTVWDLAGCDGTTAEIWGVA